MLVNAELVRLGYAQVATYLPDVTYQDLFLKLQREAREAGRGSGSVSDRKEMDGAQGGENPYFTKLSPPLAH